MLLPKQSASQDYIEWRILKSATCGPDDLSPPHIGYATTAGEDEDVAAAVEDNKKAINERRILIHAEFPY